MQKISIGSGERVLKSKWVRYVRFFCAAAVMTVAAMEVWTNVTDAEALGWGGIAGLTATAIGKKFALIA